MADIGQAFDATSVAPQSAPGALPSDWYNVLITDSEMVETKAKTGSMLKLTMKVMDGPNAGRLLWDRLNLYNPNPVAVEIAQKTLSSICHATGVMQVQDSSVLHGIPIMVRAVHKPASGGYDESNDIKGYAAFGSKTSNNEKGVVVPIEGGSTPAAPPVAPPAAPPVAPPAAFTPPVAAPAAATQTVAPPVAPPWG